MDIRRNIRGAATVLACFMGTSWLTPAAAQAIPQAVDRDSDGLIEINNLDDLNEIRNDLRGRTLRGSSVGCPDSGCYGYELTRDLDFDSNGNGERDAEDWNVGRPWTPIQGTKANVPLDQNRFTGEFNGNGHAIRNLQLRRITNVLDYGLFGVLSGAYVHALRLERVDVNVFGGPNYHVGGLAGRVVTQGSIEFVAVDGTVISDTTRTMGGLIGEVLDSGLAFTSFSGEVAHLRIDGDLNPRVGGLVGITFNTKIITSHAKGRVSGTNVAGLVESTFTTGIVASWSNVDVVGLVTAAGLVNRAIYSNAGVPADVQANPDYYTLHDVYALGTVSSGTGTSGGLITSLSMDAGVTVVIENSYAKNVLTNSATGNQTTNLVRHINGSGLVARSSYWVKDPAGAILPAMSSPTNSPVANVGQLLADMQCATPTSGNSCASPLLFRDWDYGYWDFGTATELPALHGLRDYRWVSADSPNSSGDHESMSALRTKYPDDTCDTPLTLYAKEKNSAYVFSANGGAPAHEVLEKFSAAQGLVCKNAQQTDGACDDYSVRYLCNETPAFGTVRWKDWTSRDTPTSGDGDDETIPSGQVCGAGGPIGIEARAEGRPGFRRGPPRKLGTFSATKGLKCLNADGTCKDFHVRMVCPVRGDR